MGADSVSDTREFLTFTVTARDSLGITINNETYCIVELNEYGVAAAAGLRLGDEISMVVSGDFAASLQVAHSSTSSPRELHRALRFRPITIHVKRQEEAHPSTNVNVNNNNAQERARPQENP